MTMINSDSIFKLDNSKVIKMNVFAFILITFVVYVAFLRPDFHGDTLIFLQVVSIILIIIIITLLLNFYLNIFRFGAYLTLTPQGFDMPTVSSEIIKWNSVLKTERILSSSYRGGVVRGALTLKIIVDAQTAKTLAERTAFLPFFLRRPETDDVLYLPLGALAGNPENIADEFEARLKASNG